MGQRTIYQREIEERIKSFNDGDVFTTKDFIDIANEVAVRKVLSRLNESGVISRALWGIYYKPAYSVLIKSYVKPSIDKIAKALARRYNWTIAPAGDTAANMLHLITQVPNTYEYISSGPNRNYVFDNCTLSANFMR